MVNTLPTISQQGNSWSFNNQLFSSRDAAVKAQNRWINTTWRKPPTIAQSVNIAQNQLGWDNQQISNALNTTQQKVAWTQQDPQKMQTLNAAAQHFGNLAKQEWQQQSVQQNPWPIGDVQDPAIQWAGGQQMQEQQEPWSTLQGSTWVNPQQSSWSWLWWSWQTLWTQVQNQWWSGTTVVTWGNAASMGWAAMWPWWVPMIANTTAIWDTIPNNNAGIQNQSAQNAQWAAAEQNAINNIASQKDAGLFNSPDSTFWNKFGNPAIEQESQLPWYMNERNKVIAQQLMLKNPNMKFMSNEARINAIIQEVVERQWWSIDPSIMDWYQRTAENINNLITQNIPPYTANDFFNMMLNGKLEWPATSLNANNPSFKAAKQRYDNLTKYSAMDANGLSWAMRNWELTPWSVTWNDLINKGMGEVLNKANAMFQTNMSNNIYNSVMNSIFSFDPDVAMAMQEMWWLDLWTWLEWVVSAKILATMTENDYPTFWAYLAQDDDVQRARLAARTTEDKLVELGEQIENFADDVKATVVEKWWQATWDPFLEAYIQEKTQPFLKTWKTLNSQYRNEISALELASENAKISWESLQYQREMKLKWYQFVLGLLEKQNAKKTEQQKAAYDKAKDERDFAFKVADSDRKFGLDMAKFQYTMAKDARGWSWTSAKSQLDILQGIYNGTLSSSAILNKKTLESFGMDTIPRADQVNTFSYAMFSNYLEPSSSYKEINTVMQSLQKAFGNDLKANDALQIMRSSLWWQKTLNYVLNDWWKFIDPTNKATTTQIATSLLAATGWGNITNTQPLYDALLKNLSKNDAVDVLDLMWLQAPKKNLRQRITWK